MKKYDFSSINLGLNERGRIRAGKSMSVEQEVDELMLRNKENSRRITRNLLFVLGTAAITGILFYGLMSYINPQQNYQ